MTKVRIHKLFGLHDRIRAQDWAHRRHLSLQQWVIALLMLMAGCSSGAVQFAATPIPVDLSPLQYTHPGGVFSVQLPRNWSVYTQQTTDLVSAAFTAPNEREASLIFSVINLGEEIDSTTFGDMINRYQRSIRPDANRYAEQNRQAMGDGSWRLTGLRHTPGGRTQTINTFIERSGTFVGVIDVIVSTDNGRLAVLERAINTFAIDPSAAMNVTKLETLSATRRADLDILNVSSWVTVDGVLFIMGEVANAGTQAVSDVPVRVVLLDDNERAIVEAVDIVMGYQISPGEFAPFSLRFGEGQASSLTSFEIVLGDAAWSPQADRAVVSVGALDWTDESQFTPDGQLVVTGSVRNSGDASVSNPRVIVTVFDTNRNVIAASFVDITPTVLEAGDDAAFNVQIAELGADPEFYIVNIQALPSSS